MGELPVTRRVASALIVASYSTLGFILLWSRLNALDQSYWHDEIVTLVDYVRKGPDEILFGTYVPNNHELFSLFSWVTSSLLGESEITLRLWSVFPFILGVVLVTAWLHVRICALTALLYLFFATLCPLILDLSRQARGYGLAFLAMSVMVVAASEAARTGRFWAIATFCAAGVAGAWTLPIFGIAFLATGVVLLRAALPARRLMLGLIGSTFAIVAWYAPQAKDLWTSSQGEFGQPIPLEGIFIAPIEQLLLPAFLPSKGYKLPNETYELTTAGEVAGIAALGILLASSPLLRSARTALVLGSSVAATLTVVWATRVYLLPRFISYLLVPLLIFLSSGMARTLQGFGARRAALRVTAICVPLGTLILLTQVFVSSAAEITQLPREAHKNAAAIIRKHAPSSAPVFAYMLRPRDLDFYLSNPVRAPKASNVDSKVCDSGLPVVLVVQPHRIPPVEVSCLNRVGVRHYRFQQYSRGGEMNVWFVPPPSETARATPR